MQSSQYYGAILKCKTRLYCRELKEIISFFYFLGYTTLSCVHVSPGPTASTQHRWRNTQQSILTILGALEPRVDWEREVVLKILILRKQFNYLIPRPLNRVDNNYQISLGPYMLIKITSSAGKG